MKSDRTSQKRSTYGESVILHEQDHRIHRYRHVRLPHGMYLTLLRKPTTKVIHDVAKDKLLSLEWKEDENTGWDGIGYTRSFMFNKLGMTWINDEANSDEDTPEMSVLKIIIRAMTAITIDMRCKATMMQGQ